MANLTKLLVGAGAALVLSACGQTQNPAATQTAAPAPVVDQAAEAAKAQLATEMSNEQVVQSFYMPGITLAQRLDLMSPDYVQHNPEFVRFGEINHVQGKDAFKLMLETLSKLRGGGNPFGPPPTATKGPKPPQGNLLYNMTANNDLVTVVHQRYLPDPQHPGKFYEAYGFDTFRLKDGKFTEHWDDATIPANPPIFLREPVSKLHFPKQTQPAID